MTLRPLQDAPLLLASLAFLAASSPALAQCSRPGAGSGPGARAAGPGPSAPATPGPAAGLPGVHSPPTPRTTPAGPPVPGLVPDLGPGNPATGGEVEVDWTAWELWWGHNRHAWIDLDEARGALGALRTETPGPAGSTPGPTRGRLSVETAHDTLAPALAATLAASDDPRVVGEVLLALGRLGPDPRPTGVDRSPLLAGRLADGDRHVSELAVLALGLHGSPQAALHLADLVADSPAGRAALASSRVDERRRAFACYGLGLAARRSRNPEVTRFAAHHLLRVLAEADDRHDDLAAASVLALGMLPPETPGLDADALVERLLGILRDARAPEMLRFHAPTALARLAAGASDPLREELVDELLARLAPRARVEDEVRESAVLALGLLGDADEDERDERLRDTLLRLLRRGEPVERRYAAVALAQVASRPGVGAGRALAGARPVAVELARELARGRSRHRPWVGLSLGLLGHGLRGEGRLLERVAADALLDAATGARAPQQAAAYGLGTSLLRDRRATPTVSHRFAHTHEEFHRQNLALALGLMGDGESRGELAAEMAETAFHPERYEHAALGRALLGDGELVEELVTSLMGAGSWAETTGCARALGWVGDAACLAPLLSALSDTTRTGFGRASVARALGWIGDATGRPWEDPLAAGVNYVAAPPTLTDPRGTGVLDML